MPPNTGLIMLSMAAYHRTSMNSWNVCLNLENHILPHGFGYMTSTVIGWSPCQRHTRRDLRLGHFIMPLCAVSMVSWSVWSLHIHRTYRTSTAGAVLTRLRYMLHRSGDISTSPRYSLKVVQIPTLVTTRAGFHFTGYHRADIMSRWNQHSRLHGSS